jgi:hypothetical protein
MIRARRPNERPTTSAVITASGAPSAITSLPTHDQVEAWHAAWLRSCGTGRDGPARGAQRGAQERGG